MGLFSKSPAQIESAIKHQQTLIAQYKKEGRKREMESAQDSIKRLKEELAKAKKK